MLMVCFKGSEAFPILGHTQNLRFNISMLKKLILIDCVLASLGI
jgi:hypothetical protein